MTQDVEQRREIAFARLIRYMAASSEFSRSRLALGFDEGAQLVWDPKGSHDIMPFASEMLSPRLAINRGGYVIAAADKSVEVYDSKEGKLVFVASYSNLPASPVSVMPAPQPNQFSILTQSGDLLVFEVSNPQRRFCPPRCGI